MPRPSASGAIRSWGFSSSARGASTGAANPSLPEVAPESRPSHWERMSRRKKSHQSHGSANRPRLWGRHAVAAALDNPKRRILKAWATRDAAAFMQFPGEVAVTLADVADLGRLVPNDAPHQGVVIEVEPLEDAWLDDLLTRAPDNAVLLVLDQVTDPHNVGAILRSAAAFGALGIVTQDRHSPPESGV